MKRTLFMLSLWGLLFVGGESALAGDATPQELKAAARRANATNGRCPVMGKLVLPNGGAATHDGERIAFCCPTCEAKFKADPTRYMDRMRLNPPKYGWASKKPTLVAVRAAKAAVRTANGRCPVMGKVVSATGGVIRHADQKIGFCCPPCVAKFRKNPERYMRLMRADPLAYGYDRPGPTSAQLRSARKTAGSVNGLCPVMRRLVTTGGGSSAHRGEKIAFCCPGCSAKFRANPEKFMARLRAEPTAYGYVRSVD